MLLNNFNIVLYFIVLPLLLYNSIKQYNLLLLLCFFIIALSHLYKDIYQDTRWNWPKWTERYGFLIGFVLFYVSNNIIIKLIGLAKILAHIRQYLYNDNIYYFNF